MTMTALGQPRCTRPASPTCKLPSISPRRSENIDVQYTCPHCQRIWRVKFSTGNQPYWRWNGTEYGEAGKR